MTASLEQARADRKLQLISTVTRIALFAIVPALLVRDVLVVYVQPSGSAAKLVLLGFNWLLMASLLFAGGRAVARRRLELGFALSAAAILSYVFGVMVLRERSQIVCSFGVTAIVAMAYLVDQRVFLRTVVAAIALFDLGLVVVWAAPWQRLSCPAWLEALEAIGIATGVLWLVFFALRRRCEESEADVRLVREAADRQALWAQAGEKSVALLSEELDALQGTIATLQKQAAEQEAMVARSTSALQELSASAGANAEGARRLVEVAEGSRAEVARATRSFEQISQDAARAVGLVDESRGLAQNVAVVAAQVDSVLGFLQRILGSLRLLSINARLEAARAGEAGRGFAVVVGELMALLEETQGNFEQSKRLLSGIKADAARSAELSEQGAKAVGAEAQTVSEASGVLQSMTGSLAVMTSVASPIGAGALDQKQGVADLVLATEQQRELADAIQRSVARLGELSERLRQMREEIEATARAAA